MIIKSGVRVFGLRPEILLALIIAEPLFEEEGEEMVVTSLIEGKHSRGSLHYAGAAVDLRTNPIAPAAAKEIRDELQRRLGPDYDVVLEKTHLHIEFQPKKPYQ